MKSFSAILLTLCMLLSTASLSACNNVSSAEKAAQKALHETVTAAINNTLKVKSYEAKVETVCRSDIEGRKSEKTVKTDITAAALDSDRPKLAADTTVTENGSTSDRDTYFDGAWKYFDMRADGGYRTAATLAEFAQEIRSPEALLVSLPEALFSGADKKENSDGSVDVTLTVDEAAVESLYKETVSDLVGNDLSQVTTKDASITLTVVSGYVCNYRVSFSAKLPSGASHDVSIAMELVTCNEEVDLPVPVNIDKYREPNAG